MSKLSYDLNTKEFMVISEGITLLDYYIDARKEAKISISKLTRDSGLDHPSLYVLEHPRYEKKSLNRNRRDIGKILIALETLGYLLEVG